MRYMHDGQLNTQLERTINRVLGGFTFENWVGLFETLERLKSPTPDYSWYNDNYSLVLFSVDEKAETTQLIFQSVKCLTDLKLATVSTWGIFKYLHNVSVE